MDTGPERDDAYRRREDAMLPPSLFDNLRAFVDDALQLVRKEIDLAKAEVAEKFAQARTGLIFLFVGLLFAAVAVFLLMQSLVAWLATYFGTAGAALIVGLVVLVIAIIALAIGASNLKPRNLKPERTLRSTSENTRRLKETFHDKVK